jgi:hypothetical protein
MPNDTSRTTTGRGDGPVFTLTPPATPEDAVLKGGPQGDQPAGAIERVYLQRHGRINGPDDVQLFVQAIPDECLGVAVQVELRDVNFSPGGRRRAVSHIVAPGTLIRPEHLRYEAQFAGPTWSERILTGLCAFANTLHSEREALRAGEAFVRETVDYRNPDNALEILRARGCEIHNEAAVRALVEGDPGPTYYGSLDLDENGESWERGGGRWIDRISRQAAEAGALTEPPERQ